MPSFVYRAVDAGGHTARGRLIAATESAVVRELESRGLVPINVRKSAVASEGRRGFGSRSRRAVLEFTRGMAALLPAGMPLSRALTVSSVSAGDIRPALDRVRSRVERGDELARALAEEGNLFNPLYIGVVRAGEKGGTLDSAFQRLAAHLERENDLRSKLVSMSIYPAMLCAVGLASVLVLVLFVIPRFSELLTSSGAPLPASTAFVLGVTTAARSNWKLLLAFILALGMLLLWMRGSVSGRSAAAHLLGWAPIVGAPRRQVLAARFTRMAGELLNSGAPLLSALQDTEQCLEDPLAREVTIRIRARVREGGSLNQAIGEHALFPQEVVQLVALGEEAGRLAEFLLKTSDLLERRIERTLERLVAMVEPAMIILFGGVIALVALSLLQAIYGVNVGTL
ncbi:type II secretion system F family protein [Gemmatimonadota bacterium]